MKYYYVYDTEIGPISLVEGDKHITNLTFGGEAVEGLELKETTLIKEAKRQLDEYFGGRRMIFDLPIKLEGTEFQKKVWQALEEIPYGMTYSYGQIAEKIGNPRAARAVGLTNNKNPIAIIIPCHRVIGKDGSLVGYGGGLKIKEFLLDLEKRHS